MALAGWTIFILAPLQRRFDGKFYMFTGKTWLPLQIPPCWQPAGYAQHLCRCHHFFRVTIEELSYEHAEKSFWQKNRYPGY